MERSQILLADANQLVLKRQGPFLEQKGFPVNTVENGAEAANLINQKNFDIVITDIQLIGLTGIDVFL